MVEACYGRGRAIPSVSAFAAVAAALFLTACRAAANKTTFTPADSAAEMGLRPTWSVPPGVRSTRTDATLEPLPGQRPLFDTDAANLAVYDARYGVLRVARRTGPSGILKVDSLALPFATAPVGIVLRGDTLWVLDRARALYLTRLRDGGAEVIRRITLSHRADALCATTHRLFVRGYAAGTALLHAYALNGDALADFSTPVSAPAPIMEAQFSRGGVLCDRNANVVVVTFDALAEWRAYQETGQPLFTRRLVGYRPVGAVGGWDPEPFVARDYSQPFDDVWAVRHLSGDTAVILGVVKTVTPTQEVRLSPWSQMIAWRDAAVGARLTMPLLTLAQVGSVVLVHDGQTLQFRSSAAERKRRP